MVPFGDGIRQQLIDLGIPDPGPVGGGGYTGPLLTPTLLFLGASGGRGEGREFIVMAYGSGDESGLIGLALPTSP